MPVLIDHLERRLGRMTNSWRGDSRPGLPTFNVGGFADGVIADTTSYATLGLSKLPLHHPSHDRHFFVELIAAAHDPAGAFRDSFLGALEFMWTRSLNSREVVLRGDVVSLPSEVMVASRFSFLYAALPVYYDDAFKSVVVESGDEVAVVWLVPITSSEAKFVAERGWKEFEQELVKIDPDLLDMSRQAIA
ncbi:suppressor of fused domain protein [Paractinoplanes atraurantiacus]|uniref:suppressor of fused domain protein n=1 Tax=Paractinoplanes atraurantiacus TaxID=1036182 RepID=UPI00117815FB|nr:suppressor of fused domain protein [Actinoplanes atraurantiacus]